MPAEKSMNFGPSAKRLLGRLRPERVPLVVVVVLGDRQRRARRHRAEAPRPGDRTSSSTASIGQQLPAGVTKRQVVAAAAGQRRQDSFADMVARHGR